MIVAISAVIATVALLGIFVLYLIDTIGGDDGSTTHKTSTSGPSGLTTRPPSLGTTGGVRPGTSPPASSGGTTGGGVTNPSGRIPGGLPGAP
jgi:hypothetical protein